ncbi:hypothetical protein [Moorella sp. E306M]|uniref:hypothetical protein n=1 Tax=Moorella sp. E306M TaxID=2572683 RepID=UPI0010FFACB1|nr:hypothetical protein [Moorella sp. E306M]GEA17769.1 hypothetical protein E306M_09030 [Moorella sp. E306M]GEA17838.1 hypothetical protein E306M_09720 [Moorella sp. E306M]
MATQKVTAVNNVSNDGAAAIMEPYLVEVTIQGTADILFHRWSNEDVEAKANAAKNSTAKKTDNLEAYVYRNEKGEICIPGKYLHGAIIGAAKFKQDPRSPRKSAQDLFKAGIAPLTPLASLGVKEWDYLDKSRVVIQRNAVTRIRPAMLAGWKATFLMQVLLPEYITPQLLNEVIQQAGRLIGIGDYRPTYGRFAVIKFEVITDKEQQKKAV